jgi:hypothetical protein
VRRPDDASVDAGRADARGWGRKTGEWAIGVEHSAGSEGEQSVIAQLQLCSKPAGSPVAGVVPQRAKSLDFAGKARAPAVDPKIHVEPRIEAPSDGAQKSGKRPRPIRPKHPHRVASSCSFELVSITDAPPRRPSSHT